jgi:hypothetical protein
VRTAYSQRKGTAELTELRSAQSIPHGHDALDMTGRVEKADGQAVSAAAVPSASDAIARAAARERWLAR